MSGTELKNNLLSCRRSFIDFQVWDFPGQINFFETAYDSQEIFGEVGALIFVIDAQARIHFMIVRRYSLRI